MVGSDLETRVSGHSRSSKIIPFNPAPIVTVGLSRTFSEINGDIRRKSQIFRTLCVFNALDEGVPLGIGYRRKGHKSLNDGATWSKSFKIGLVVLIQYRL